MAVGRQALNVRDLKGGDADALLDGCTQPHWASDDQDCDGISTAFEPCDDMDWVDSCTSPTHAVETVYDLIANDAGDLVLLPLDMGEPIEVSHLHDDDVVTIRAIRFFEDRGDEAMPWEQELRNVNSGSLLWLPIQLEPKMHSCSGAKYGKWFTVHHIKVYAKHFCSGYHMAEEGACPLAKTFGVTSVSSVVTGEALPKPYFWFVSPSRHGDKNTAGDAEGEENLRQHGWQHVSREGPFDGDAFLAAWRANGSSLVESHVKQVLASMMSS